MSETTEHLAESLEAIAKSHPELYQDDPELIKKIMLELHEWLDEFSGTGDYVGRLCIRHRRERHHAEGISEITEILSEKYGPKYMGVIRQEARRHVIADFRDSSEPIGIPQKSDYDQIGFWRRIGAY